MNQIMWAKEMCLKKINEILFFIIIFFSILIISFPSKGNEKKYLNDIINYLNNFSEFSSNFLQIQNNEVSEGKIYLQNERLRIEYTSPTPIIFILKEKKGMYYNKELQEVEYFNPKDTIGQFIIELFTSKDFLSNSKINIGKGYFNIFKEINYNQTNHKVEIYFERQPLQIRKLQIYNEDGITSFTILNLDFNPILNKKFFSLANPLLS